MHLSEIIHVKNERNHDICERKHGVSEIIQKYKMWQEVCSVCLTKTTLIK